MSSSEAVDGLICTISQNEEQQLHRPLALPKRACDIQGTQPLHHPSNEFAPPLRFPIDQTLLKVRRALEENWQDLDKEVCDGGEREESTTRSRIRTIAKKRNMKRFRSVFGCKTY